MNAARLEKARRCYFDQNAIDCIFVTDLINVRYLSGFTGTNAQLLLLKGEPAPFLLTDGRYTGQATKQCKGFKVLEYKDDPISLISSIFKDHPCKKFGFEGSRISYSRYRQMESGFSQELVPIKEESSHIRMIKEKSEIDALQEAARIAASSFRQIVPKIRPGISENGLALELEFAMRRMGSECLSFDTIIAAGVRGALPHGIASDAIIQEGDLVVFDYGSVYKGYHSDETITFTVGKPNKKQQEIFDIVKTAQAKAIEKVKPGASCKEIDRIAREYIEKKGYGDKFIHSTGHGVGLEIHEPPRLSSISTEILEEGMVVTVEPGIYLEGWGGVRIEDMILVQSSQAQVITQLDKSSLKVL